MNERQLKNLYYIYTILTAIVCSGLILGVLYEKLSVLNALQGFMAYFLAAVIICIPFGLSWWKKVDEAVREAHKSAWFWGGSIGMTIMIGLVTANLFLDRSILAGLIKHFHFEGFEFELGMLMTVFLMSYGYIAAWMLWWSKRR